jgi:hypothetical protein
VSNDRIGQCARTPSAGEPRLGVLAVEDPRVAALRSAVGRLGRELAAYPHRLPERQVAQEELAALDARAASGTLSVAGLRASLLVVAGALGSVSALSASLAQVHQAIDLFGRV